MKISLRNIAKVKQADVEINGITVIAGANNTGKSTVGKALYSVFNSFYNAEAKQLAEKTSYANNFIKFTFASFFYDISSEDAMILVEKLYPFLSNIETSDNYKNAYSLLLNSIPKKILTEKGDEVGKTIKKIIYDLIEVYQLETSEIINQLFQTKINGEFSGQVNTINNNSTGEIVLAIQDKTITAIIDGNLAQAWSNEVNLNSEIIYIDDPNVLNENFVFDQKFVERTERNHSDFLRFKLFQNELPRNQVALLLSKNKLETLNDKLDYVCRGSLSKMNGKYVYKDTNFKEPLEIKNLSTGLKTFAILKTLLFNGSIKNRVTIILDEPEIHLHPEWQLIFAELLVLLQKTFNLHILLNTHSPYFLRAIQVYSAKHEIADKCKYYLSRVEDDGAYIDDVSDDIEQIYKSLVHPLQMLENEEWEING